LQVSDHRVRIKIDLVSDEFLAMSEQTAKVGG
jgi:hypothetical protein